MNIFLEIQALFHVYSLHVDKRKLTFEEFILNFNFSHMVKDHSI